MTADTYFAVVCQLADARPFRPFVIELQNGTQHVIEDPRALAIHKLGGTAYWPANGRLHIFDHTGVVSVSPLPPDQPVIVMTAS